jgi:hypothetical protein
MAFGDTKSRPLACAFSSCFHLIRKPEHWSLFGTDCCRGRKRDCDEGQPNKSFGGPDLGISEFVSCVLSVHTTWG